MGRIVDLCGEIAASAEEGPDGLIVPPDVWDRLRQEWEDDDINDALGLVHDSLLQSELVESTESLASRVLEMLEEFSEAIAFQDLEAGEGRIALETVGHLARRLARLEEVLEVFRDGPGPDRAAFDTLRSRLADVGIQDEMDEGREMSLEAAREREEARHRHDDDDDDDD